VRLCFVVVVHAELYCTTSLMLSGVSCGCFEVVVVDWRTSAMTTSSMLEAVSVS